MPQDILVLGAGMVGTCAALELTLRGHAVTLVDRRAPGQETSYGNAGLIQREAVEPYAFPRDWDSVLSIVLQRKPDVHYHLAGLVNAAPQLARYWTHSAPANHRRISREYSPLIQQSTSEHERLMAGTDAHHLVRRDGFRAVFHTGAALQKAAERAVRLQREYGVEHVLLDAAGLGRAEPALRVPLAGAIHWTQPWSVSDPGALVEAYARLFQQRGGRLVVGDAMTLKPSAKGWGVETDEGFVDAAQAVIALGPWAGRLTRSLGYRFPLFVKRGYHRHYSGGDRVSLPMLAAERGFVLAPMERGLRITSGAEIAGLDAGGSPVQLDAAEKVVRGFMDLGQAVEGEPWRGARPCSADMKPVISAAPRHAGLWFDFGHGHQGFTLGAVSARLVADLIDGFVPFIDPAGFSALRFGG